MVYNVQQVAEKLGISEYAVSKLCKTGVLKHLPIPEGAKKAYYRIDESTVKEYRVQLKAERIAQREELARKAVEQANIPTTVPEGFINKEEMAAVLGVSPNTLWGWVEQGKLEKIMVKNRAYFRRVHTGPALNDSAQPTANVDLPDLPLPDAKTINIFCINARFARLETIVVDLQNQINKIIEGLGGL